MKLPEINLKELEEIKKRNFKERLEFQDRYVEWMKMTSNARWSSAQKTLINKKSKPSTRSSRKSSATKKR